MKILKVELQNINSLKSDSPIVIDFESEEFKDVGLYAITGSTGAGKTTILDAMTIAMYHNVPRFNGTKGALVDVISHGSRGAFSRVTFENDSVIYEAFWGIRVISKAGKPLTKPQETVSLKNITTGEIIADQKRNLITEILRVTQLDYTQFLRSVMLAQGEFASFLSAKGPEKGKLLEQITGEQIYKKIGQGILDRKSQEEAKLREIQSLINSDDILTDEQKIELTQKDKELDVEIKKVAEEAKSIQLIVDWYIKFQENIEASELLEQQSFKLDTFIETHKTELDLLDLNEKAEPFKELIQHINKNEKDRTEKLNQLERLETELVGLKPKVENLESLSKNHSADLVNANEEFDAWLPKFDLITEIDGQLKNQSENKKNAEAKLDELQLEFQNLSGEREKINTELTETENKLKTDELFISENSFLDDVHSEISNWTTDLTTLKANKETINEQLGFVHKKTAEVEKTREELTKNDNLLIEKTDEVKKIEKQITKVSKQLSKNSIPDLIAQKNQLSTVESNWKQFKTLSDQTITAQKNQKELLAKQKSLSTELVTVKSELSQAEKQIKIQEKLVKKAEQILNLEKTISKYEDDRKQLKEGEPCGLCGSKEHPYVKGVEHNVSEAEIELEKTKDDLKAITDSKNEADKREVKLTTTIDGLAEQIESIKKDLASYKSDSKKLSVDCKLTDSDTIETELNNSTAQMKELDETLAIAQELQEQNNDLSERIKTQNEAVTTLKTEIATLTANLENATSEIETKNASVDSLTDSSTDLENELKSKLSKFNYELPAIDDTNAFIKKIEASIVHYNKVQKNLDALKAESKVFQTKLANTKKQSDLNTQVQTEHKKIITGCDATSTGLSTERANILPQNVTAKDKRESLQLVIKQFTEKAEASKKELQKLLDTKTEKEALKVKNKEDQTALNTETKTFNTELDSLIKNSVFGSKLDVEKALLSPDDKAKFIKNRERITENQLKLKALKEENLKTKEELNKSKKEDLSEEESKSSLKELTDKKENFLTEKGRIAEAFRKEQEIRDRNQEVYKRIDAQGAICTTWRELFRIIGNSKDAFNVYVQRLTLKHLLDFANVHLYKLNQRYSLKMEEAYKPKEELNFNLIDHYQTDQARLVDTSSGGEKFTISLALALGLSDLASKNVKIDSLFIDEGFGTLDSNTLETVISTLETLQSQGKMIGIISHVENLKERIPTQIKVTKKSNGVSTVAIV